ncbi:MAG: tRNA (adenosine(37)-N6)-threonylcarbamoyltransferase complex ATPase subunit type 1 TsaE [Kangiellaceae bacterium]|nr:tRNA (adenosine(37)-N6)-threonylcarbamoyltransferase complex ATPase subunit type 1 TsaE [Kangiellaceae bacterium]
MSKIELFLADEQKTRALGQELATYLCNKLQQAQTAYTIYLQGQLGAGKTTLVRGLLQGLGHTGSTKSPTYTLVEPYKLAAIEVYHFDLYRLADPEELEFIGIREYIEQHSILIFEWPDQGQGVIPRPDMVIELEYKGTARFAQIGLIEPQDVDNLRQKLANCPDFMPKSD